MWEIEGRWCLLSIGEKIRKLRKERGITQRDLSNATNFSHSYIGDLECDRTCPSIKTLERLAEYFEVEIGYFFESQCCYQKLLYGLDKFCHSNKDECKSCPIREIVEKN